MFPFIDNHVVARFIVDNIRWHCDLEKKKMFLRNEFGVSTSKHMLLTYNVQIAQLTLHRIGVYLTLETVRANMSWLWAEQNWVNSFITMYHPWSVSFTSLMCNCQMRFSVWPMPMRWFLVITWCWIVKIVCVSTRSQATWSNCQSIVRWARDINSQVIAIWSDIASLTLNETKSWTTHDNIASLPTGTVTFVMGALKFGSAENERIETKYY